MSKRFGISSGTPADGWTKRKLLTAAAAAVLACGPLHALADGDRDDDGKGDGHKQKLLRCDDSMKTQFKPDSLTTVLLVKAYKKGDALALANTPATPAPPTAANDVCVVKLLVGPGNPGPAGLPSTSPGIGIEVWLPSSTNWNHRIHVIGGGGWAGGVQGDVTRLAGATSATGPTSTPMVASTVEGA